MDCETRNFVYDLLQIRAENGKTFTPHICGIKAVYQERVDVIDLRDEMALKAMAEFCLKTYFFSF